MYIHVGEPINLFYGPVYYHENKIGEGVAKRLMDTTYENDPKDKAEYLYDVTKQNPWVTSNRGFDIAVTFHPDEILDDKEMKLLAMETMSGLKFDNVPYVVYRHNDKPHPHFHIIVPSVNFDGKKIEEFNIRYRAKKLAISLEKRYSLRHTERVGKSNVRKDYLVEHYSISKAAKNFPGDMVKDIPTKDLLDKSIKQLNEEYGKAKTKEIRKFFNDRGMINKSEREQLEEALNIYRSTTYSFSGFRKALEQDGFYVTKLKNNNLVYKLPEGNYYFQDFKITKDFTYNQLNDYYKKGRSMSSSSRSTVDPFVKRMANRVFEQSRDLESFVENLFDKGIAVQFATYEDGSAYGISFINQKTGEELKGSQVGLSLKKVLSKYSHENKPYFDKNNRVVPSQFKRAKSLANKLGYQLEKTEKDVRNKKRD